MQIVDKEEQIRKKIEEITGISADINKQVCYDLVKSFREFTIEKILLITPSFNYFQLEEEGRLTTLFSEWCTFTNDIKPPTITHVETGNDALKKIQNDYFDLIIFFNNPSDVSIEYISKSIKEKTDTPIVLIGNNIAELEETQQKTKGTIDKFFTWNGDGAILVSIVHYFEDQINLNRTESLDNISCILLIEDSIQHYSSYITVIHEEICSYLKRIIDDSLNCEQKRLRYNRRPFIIHTSTIENTYEFFERYKAHISFIITDNQIKIDEHQKSIGIDIANKAAENEPSIPTLIQSSEEINRKMLLNQKTPVISKMSTTLLQKIRIFIKDHIGPYDIIFRNKQGKEIYRIEKIKDLSNAIEHLSNDVFSFCLKDHRLSTWLKSIGEIEIAKKFFRLEKETSDISGIKQRLKEIIEEYHYSINQAAITHFSRRIDDPNIKISRIGSGALGGKARGIAFLAKILSKYLYIEPFDNLSITIPRSIVLSTEVFDQFMQKNNLDDLDFTRLSDDRISSRFMGASLPPTVLGDLRTFIRNTRKPLIVRSSGLLEDSLMQPFAGIYESMLLPNDSWETDLRFQEVCNAIKHVYASTYFEKARTYIRSTPKHIGDEKMAVLIQEVVGTRKGRYFYPTISGVAKSYNFYPSGSCKAEEGIVYLALGLGKAIVDGGNSYAFCPTRPKSPLYGTAKDYMKYAQTSFYALNLHSIYNYVNYDEETSLDTLDLDTAKKHGELQHVVSTYMAQDDRIYPGIYDEGSYVVDFAPLLTLNTFPLAKTISLLLEISEIALGYAVEIEFAVNIPKDEKNVAELVILQIRNMVSPNKQIHFDPKKVKDLDIILQSTNIMGHEMISEISDILYIDQEHFDLSHSIQIVDQIKQKNNQLMDKNIPYILIGPGRWGSSDPWLGIPVIWSNIAGACAIVETPYKDRHIDPSQGSHFFHDMIASNVVYLITKKNDDINWKWIRSQTVVESSKFIKHIRTTTPLDIIVDSTKGFGMIIKTRKRKKD